MIKRISPDAWRRVQAAVRRVERMPTYTPERSRRVSGGKRGVGGGNCFVVRVQNDGGSSGGASSPCSYSYEIYPLESDWPPSGDPLATGLSPAHRPTSHGRYSVAPSGSFGLATIDPDTDDYVLLIAYEERLYTTSCEVPEEL